MILKKIINIAPNTHIFIFIYFSHSTGWYVFSCVPGGHVCSSGGGQRCPRGRVQHGGHTGHHELQVCITAMWFGHTASGSYSLKSFCVCGSGSTSTVPVEPRYPQHWFGTTLNHFRTLVKKKCVNLWTTSVGRVRWMLGKLEISTECGRCGSGHGWKQDNTSHALDEIIFDYHQGLVTE